MLKQNKELKLKLKRQRISSTIEAYEYQKYNQGVSLTKLQKRHYMSLRKQLYEIESILLNTKE